MYYTECKRPTEYPRTTAHPSIPPSHLAMPPTSAMSSICLCVPEGQASSFQEGFLQARVERSLSKTHTEPRYKPAAEQDGQEIVQSQPGLSMHNRAQHRLTHSTRLVCHYVSFSYSPVCVHGNTVAMG